jgi:hypothetical protein
MGGRNLHRGSLYIPWEDTTADRGLYAIRFAALSSRFLRTKAPDNQGYRRSPKR